MNEVDNFSCVFQDQPPYDGVRHYYAVCSTPRTGSSLLCELLARMGIGLPMEYFHPRKYMPNFLRRYGLRVSATSDLSVEKYVDALKTHRTSPSGYFGFKAHRGQFRWLARNCQLDLVFPDMQFIFVSRRDSLAQAVSASKAAQTKQWSSREKAVAIPHYDEAHIEYCLRTIHKGNDYWNGFFEERSIRPLFIEYENLVSSTSCTIECVLEFLGAKAVATPISLEDVGMVRQSDKTNTEWITRFRARTD